jgi:hypothetical protein
MIKRHLLNCLNGINHPSIFVEYSIEVVISHLVFYGLFIIQVSLSSTLEEEGSNESILV